MYHLDDYSLFLHGSEQDGKETTGVGSSTKLPCEKPAPVAVVAEILEVSATVDRATIAGRRHYVNIDSGDAHALPERHQHGKYFTLKARVEWQDRTCTDSLAGQQVKWTFAPQGGNLGPPPDYVERKANDSVGFSWYGVCVNTVTTSADDQGMTAVVYFYPGNVGGNGFTITATSVSNGASSVTTGVFEVWRRIPLFFDLFPVFTQRPYGQTPPPLAEVNQFFNPGYIEVLDAPTQARFQKRFTFGVGRYDFGFSRVDAEVTFQATQNVFIQPGHYHRLKGQAGSWLSEAHYQAPNGDWIQIPANLVTRVDLTSHSDGLPHPAAPANPDDYMDVTAYSTAGDIGDMADMANRVRITDWQIRQKIQVDLTTLNLNPTVIAPVTVRLRIRHCHFTSGNATGATPMVAFGYLLESMTLNAAREVAGMVVSHEIGHKLGFYPTAGPNYENNQGPHCNVNTCTMYWKWMAGARKVGWCAHCLGLLRQTNVRALALA